MKIKVGGSVSSKIQAAQYEPIEAISFIEIEKEVSDNIDLESYIVEEQEKLNGYLQEDVKKKLKVVYQETFIKKKKLMEYLNA